MSDNFDALLPVMPSQCFTCRHWVELNDMRSCYVCRDGHLRCDDCHSEHQAEEEEDLIEEDGQ